MKHKIELMGHIIAGYPSMQLCLCAATGILKGGAKYLEVQFPFSDGNADGSAMQKANNYSLQHGFIPNHGFTIIETLANNTSRDIIAMAYANTVFNYGLENFVKELKRCGAYGLIVPDFRFGENDFGLRQFCKDLDIYFIELATPLTPSKRIREMAIQTNAPFLYILAGSGFISNQTHINREMLDYIEDISEMCALESKDIMVGFGINNPSQISLLLDKVYGVAVGSYFIDIINKNKESNDLMSIIQKATQELLKIESFTTNTEI